MICAYCKQEVGTQHVCQDSKVGIPRMTAATETFEQMALRVAPDEVALDENEYPEKDWLIKYATRLRDELGVSADTKQARIKELEAVIRSHNIPVKTMTDGVAHYCLGEECGESVAKVVTLAQGRNAGKQVALLKDVPNGTELFTRPAIPEGYALVPVEPTDAMTDAAYDYWNSHTVATAEKMWIAMIEAAK